MDFPFSNIAIVGSGAVGCYYGARLAAGGNDVRFLMRSDLDHVRAHGLRISSDIGDDLHLTALPCFGSAAEIGKVDLVIVALKVTANTALENLLPPLLDRHTALLTLQNGLGNERFLADRFGAGRVMGGLCFVCLNRVSPGVIHHIDHGLVSLGEFGRPPALRTRALHAEFQRCGIPATLEPDLATARWRKLVWNIPFNGLSIAAGEVDVAAILADPELLDRARRLMAETIAAAAALGHRIDAGFVDEMIDRTRTMGAYRPSSLIDFQNGREVEVEAIWGRALREATAAGAEMPELSRLFSELSALCP